MTQTREEKKTHSNQHSAVFFHTLHIFGRIHNKFPIQNGVQITQVNLVYLSIAQRMIQPNVTYNENQEREKNNITMNRI